MAALGQFLTQLLGQVMGGGAEAAEHHRPEAFRQQCFELLDQLLELGVVGLAPQQVRPGDQILQVLGVFRDGEIGAGCRLLTTELLLGAIEHRELGHGFEVEGQLVFINRGAGVAIPLEVEQLGAQRGGRGSRAAADAAQQSQCRPPAHALAELALASGAAHQLAGVVEHVVEELTPVAAEGVDGFPCFTVRKISAAGAPLLLEVLAAALHEIVAQIQAQLPAAVALSHLTEPLKLGIEQTEQVVERFLVAAVGRRGEQHQVALWLLRQTPQQLIALLAAATLASRTGVGLIHDHELAAAAQEALAIAIALDPIEAHHREGDHVEDRFARR